MDWALKAALGKGDSSWGPTQEAYHFASPCSIEKLTNECVDGKRAKEGPGEKRMLQTKGKACVKEHGECIVRNKSKYDYKEVFSLKTTFWPTPCLRVCKE